MINADEQMNEINVSYTTIYINIYKLCFLEGCLQFMFGTFGILKITSISRVPKMNSRNSFNNVMLFFFQRCM